MMKRSTVAKVARAIARASEEFSIPSSWLIAFAKIESNFNPVATNGSSRGLFQMQQAAWHDANEVAKLGDYMTYWDDPTENARAAAAYMNINMIRLAKRGINAYLEPRWLYLAHQQGVSGLSELIRVSEGSQSNGIVTREAMLRNPAPGFSKTDDHKLFYENWMQHLYPYFNK